MREVTQAEVPPETLVTFASYYKYSFTFVGALPSGDPLFVHCGGTVDDIYRFSVGTAPVPVAALWNEVETSLWVEPAPAAPSGEEAPDAG